MKPTTSQAKSTVQCLDHPFYWWRKGYWANKCQQRLGISRGESCDQGNRVTGDSMRARITIIKQ